MENSDNNFYNGNYGNNINTDGTNMMVEMLANSTKLEPEGDRWYYNKNDPSNNVEEDDVDDNIDNYKKPSPPAQNNLSQQQHFSATRAETLSDKNQEKFTDKQPKNNDKYIDDDYETLTSLEKRLRRLELMRKLGELRDLGCKVTNYSIDDDYYMMKYEYELHTSIRTKRNWMSIYNHMLVGAVKGIELLNNSYNPFDFSLKGLSNEVSADKNTYYEILGEIYEHHNVPGKKMNPWFRLFITLIGTVVVVGGKNNAHKFLPGEAKNLENDTDMIEKLRAKAVQSNNQKQSIPQQAQQQAPQQMPPMNQMNQNQMLQTAMNLMSNMGGNNSNQNQPANIDDFMNKEHDAAAQRMKDLEDLKKQELEFQQYQKMLMEDANKFEKINSRLEMSQQSPTSDRLAQSVNSRTSKSSKSTKSSKPVSKKSNNDDRSTLSGQSTDSSKSVISINKQLAQQLKNMKSNDIKPSSISFGSSTKGQQNKVTSGNLRR